ncbi:hypothetical protein FPV67DRAFT_1014496 [Lyophyllum atratum]|nr:hypothetical protein FPV67DRAFT_1014496 [Lyophyllum atratum]
MIPFRASAVSHAANASPSITMEKGAYRMRAPYSKTPVKSLYPLQQPRRSRRTDPRNPSSNLAMVVVLLAFASVSSFGMAYYIFATRWDARKLSRRWIPDQRFQGVPIDIHHDSLAATHQDPNENFLAYLPHSGFHNQRIALENALVLARLLNRTLFVPPIHLGNNPIRYVQFDALYQDLVLSSKTGLEHCSRITFHAPLPLECMDYFTYTQISWDWLVDLRRVKNGQDILFIKDSAPYQFRFLDTQSDMSPSNHKYLENIYIANLKMSPKRLIHIGTLFGSSRLRLKNPSSIAIRGAIRESPDYLGVHLRLGDGQFKRDGENNTRRVWWRLLHRILRYTEEETLLLEQAFMARTPDLPHLPISFHDDARRQFGDFKTSRHRPHTLRCRSRLHTDPHLLRLNTPLFMSTDAGESNLLLSGFRRAFPCVFYLSDFPAATRHLDELYNAIDGVEMRQFMIPLLDALVVGHASKVVGTENSTFSHFIQDVLWRKFHGLAIVQRG